MKRNIRKKIIHRNSRSNGSAHSRWILVHRDNLSIGVRLQVKRSDLEQAARDEKRAGHLRKGEKQKTRKMNIRNLAKLCAYRSRRSRRY
jgi:hypothetical protein